MSRILDLFSEMREIEAELRRLEEAVAQHPQYESLTLDLLSLQKRQNQLRQEFEEVTNEQQVDVVNHLLQPGSHAKVSLRALTSTLDRFQAAISTTLDAVKNGIKQRGRLAPGIAELSSFDFGYSFDGSVGIVLTIPNDRLLFGESDLDRAIELFFAAAKAESREQLLEFAKAAGIPAVRRLYEWSQAHTTNNVSADIQWRRKDAIRSRVTVEPPTLERLEEIIEETSDVSTEAVTVVGKLVGLDTALKTFHLESPGSEDVKGGWAEAFVYSRNFALDEIYKAELVKRSIVYYAYEREDTHWELVRLERATGAKS
jgi:hypothetical protein